MPLTPIGDIGTAALTEGTEVTLTWETAAEWDNYAAISGTEHAPERDETRIRLGQENTVLSPLAFWRFYTASGSTLFDVSGNGNDGSISSNLSWSTAPSPRFAGALDNSGGSPGDAVNMGNLWSTNESFYEFEAWFYPTETGLQKIMEQNSLWTMFYDRSGNQDLNFAIFGDAADLGPSLSLNTWHHAYFRWDVGSELFAYINGSSYSASSGTGVDSTNADMGLFDEPQGDNAFTGKIAEARAWSGSSAAVSGIGDTLYLTSGSLTTATKSFASPKTPNLQNLSYTLNGQTIDLDVIGSPGTASEEVVTQTLAGASAYSLSWSNSHTDFRLRPTPSTTEAKTTPEFNRGELVA